MKANQQRSASILHAQLSIAPNPPTLFQAFVYWLKLGFISFGEPAGQIALMHTDLVERKRWISERRLNYCMVLPGSEAIQLAIYISWLLHGIVGAIMAGVLFFLPAFLILSGLAWAYLEWGQQPLAQGLFYGIKPAVVAVVLFAAWRIGSRVLNNLLLWAIALGFLSAMLLGIGFPWIVIAAALIGIVGSHYKPEYFQAASSHAQSTRSSAAYLSNYQASRWRAGRVAELSSAISNHYVISIFRHVPF